jgi:hypothetical protein
MTCIFNRDAGRSENRRGAQCTEVRFASFLSGGFITAIVVNPPERKLAKRTSVQSVELKLRGGFEYTPEPALKYTFSNKSFE